MQMKAKQTPISAAFSSLFSYVFESTKSSSLPTGVVRFCKKLLWDRPSRMRRRMTSIVSV